MAGADQLENPLPHQRFGGGKIGRVAAALGAHQQPTEPEDLSWGIFSVEVVNEMEMDLDRQPHDGKEEDFRSLSTDAMSSVCSAPLSPIHFSSAGVFIHSFAQELVIIQQEQDPFLTRKLCLGNYVSETILETPGVCMRNCVRTEAGVELFELCGDESSTPTDESSTPTDTVS